MLLDHLQLVSLPPTPPQKQIPGPAGLSPFSFAQFFCGPLRTKPVQGLLPATLPAIAMRAWLPALPTAHRKRIQRETLSALRANFCRGAGEAHFPAVLRASHSEIAVRISSDTDNPEALDSRFNAFNCCGGM